MKIRLAKKGDIYDVLVLTQQLADSENYPEPIATKEFIENSLFKKQSPISVYLIEDVGRVVGMGHVIVFPSTFSGRNYMFLQDFVVHKDFRNKGYGKKFIKFLCELAIKNNCKKITWNFLTWNTGAAEFYKKVGDITNELASCTIGENKMREIIQSF